MKNGFLLIDCLFYMAVSGILAFWIGRVLPKRWFRYDRFPYRAAAFEQGGAVYQKVGIRWWKEKLPDMSKLLPGRIPSKRLPASASADQVENMIQETCVAECVHFILCITGLRLLAIWKGPGGWICYLLYLLGNVPYCIIQRYNRPKLVRIYQKLRAKEAKV